MVDFFGEVGGFGILTVVNLFFYVVTMNCGGFIASDEVLKGSAGDGDVGLGVVGHEFGGFMIGFFFQYNSL